MAKRKKKTGNTRQTIESQVSATDSPYYCEYLCNDGQWWLQVSNPAQGYYCPSDPQLEACDESTNTYTQRLDDGLPEAEHDASQSESQGEPTPSTPLIGEQGNCHYVYSEKHKTFLLHNGDARAHSVQSKSDCYCPTDLLKFLHVHWPELERILKLGVITEITIKPRKIIACSNGTPPHGPDHDLDVHIC